VIDPRGVKTTRDAGAKHSHSIIIMQRILKEYLNGFRVSNVCLMILEDDSSPLSVQNTQWLER